MASWNQSARRALNSLPPAAQKPLRAALAAVRGRRDAAAAAMARARGADVDAWTRAFETLYGRTPQPAESTRLGALALRAGECSPRQRLRRVMAAFDQQDHPCGMEVRWDASDVRVHDVQGLRMVLDGTDEFVSMAIARGDYEFHMARFFRRFLQPGMAVVDAGANIGFYSLLSAQCVGAAGTVWSFEPNSENCRLLLASAQENGFANIRLHPVALGSRAGHEMFTSGLGSNGMLVPHGRRALADPSCRIVPVARLDDFDLARIDLLKMDVEGAEWLLVQGARDTLARCRPVIAAEFSDAMLTAVSKCPGTDFMRHFLEAGYEAWLLRKHSQDLLRIADPVAFAREFAGTPRIEDLVLCPAERSAALGR